jgi:undecaprenyl-diphosphatase
MESFRCLRLAPLGAALLCAALLPAAAAFASGATADAIAAPDPSSLDVRTFRLLNGAAENSVFDTAMPLVTEFDQWRIGVILVWCALVLFGKSRARWAALMLIPIIAASDQLSSSVIKPIFERLRPCELLGGVHLWLEDGGWMTTPADVTRSYKNSFSFPSSHATNITASMLFLGLVYRRRLVPRLAVALLVSYSRIYTGVHWPSDVLAGMLVGAAIAAIAYLIFKRFHREAAAAAAAAGDSGGAPAEEPREPAHSD